MSRSMPSLVLVYHVMGSRPERSIRLALQTLQTLIVDLDSSLSMVHVHHAQV
jgi:hypothetical protein